LCLTPPTERFPWDDLRKISMDVSRWPAYQMARNIAENFNRLSRVHERYRQTDRQTDRRTDGRTTTYSKREREFTSAKKYYIDREIFFCDDEVTAVRICRPICFWFFVYNLHLIQLVYFFIMWASCGGRWAKPVSDTCAVNKPALFSLYSSQ